jgi:HEAT repeat protein
LAGLSEWQKGMYFRAGIPPVVQIAPSVVREWRAQAEPILLRMVAARDPVWAGAYGRLSSTGPELLQRWLPHMTDALEKRKAALTAISRMGPLSPGLEAAVIQAALDPEPAVRWRAAMILGFKGSGSLETRLVFEKLCRDQAVVSRLRMDSGVVDFGLYFLPQNLQETIQALHAPFEVARREAVLTLGKYGHEPALLVPHLIRALGDSSDTVKAAAARTLGQIGPAATNALPALRDLLDSPSHMIGEATRAAIERIEAVSHTSNRLDNYEKQP